MNQIEHVWRRIGKWMQMNAPFLLTTLNPGATSDQIKTFEKKFDFSFPDTYKILVALNNGQNPCPTDHSRNIGYFYAKYFLSLKDSFETWYTLVNSKDPVIQAAFRSSFIPLAKVVNPLIVIDAKDEHVYEVVIPAPDWTLPTEWQIIHRIRFSRLIEYLGWILNQLSSQNEYEWDKKDQCWYFVKTNSEESK